MLLFLTCKLEKFPIRWRKILPLNETCSHCGYREGNIRNKAMCATASIRTYVVVYNDISFFFTFSYNSNKEISFIFFMPNSLNCTQIYESSNQTFLFVYHTIYFAFTNHFSESVSLFELSFSLRHYNRFIRKTTREWMKYWSQYLSNRKLFRLGKKCFLFKKMNLNKNSDIVYFCIEFPVKLANVIQIWKLNVMVNWISLWS